MNEFSEFSHTPKSYNEVRVMELVEKLRNTTEIYTRDMIELITTLTEPGRLTDWNERLGSVARLLGINLTLIRWSSSPENVMQDMLKEAKRVSNLSVLEIIN